MSLITFLRLFNRNFKYIALAAFLAAFGVFMITKNQKKFYHSHTLINTGLVSGYNIENQGGARTDYNRTNTELENLIKLGSAHETMEELSIRLLAMIFNGDKDTILLQDNFKELAESIPTAYLEEISRIQDEDQLIARLTVDYFEGKGNPIYDLITSKNQIVGLDHLHSIEISREGATDMIRMSFRTIDPWMSVHTLNKLTDIFIRKHKEVKSNQTTDVLKFFENSTLRAAADLEEVEEEMLEFQESNKIINYYEQTRFISGKKEDLDEQYLRELMAWAGADSALKKVEVQLASQIRKPELNIKIDSLRRQMVDLSKEMVQKQFRDDDEAFVQSASYDWEQQSRPLKEALRTYSNQNLDLTVTPDGLQTQNLLDKWLEQVINREQSNARLEIMRQRQQEFERIYERYAPLGSKLKQLERKIDVAERAYLENLHSYNQARLHQHNMMMTTNLKVTDPPFLPIKPEDSKRLLSVMLAGFTAALFVLTLVIGVEFLDQSLRDPDRAEQITGQEVIGAFPLLQMKNKKIRWDELLHRNMKLIEQNLRRYSPENKIGLISLEKSQGKSLMAERIAEHTDYKNLDEVDFLYGHPEKMDELNGYDLLILIVRANDIWSRADQRMVDNLHNNVGIPVKVLVNRVNLDHLEDFIGEIPRKRGKLRIAIKRIFNREFH